jgi:superoxide dismutase, Fe-Mn family
MLALLFAFTAHASIRNMLSEKHPFKKPELAYAEHALEIAIDAETMRLHYGKHHDTYLENLNQAIGKSEDNLKQIFANASKRDAKIRNNAGGHWNHSFYWTMMSPKEADQKMPNRLKLAIEEKFGSLERFQAAFEEAGSKQFGSGWVWLIRNRKKQLEVTTTPNQDNPLMDVAKTRGSPILGVDVWEHAYYLRYQNKRSDYLKGFWKVTNWRQVDDYDREAMGEWK